VIMQENSVLDGHWPQTGIGYLWPMNSRVQHHSAGNGHDSLDVSFSNGIVMVSSSSGETNHLFELGKLRCKFTQ
jgi:hypothetical protein